MARSQELVKSSLSNHRIIHSLFLLVCFLKVRRIALKPRVLVESPPHLCINLLSQDPFCLMRDLLNGIVVSDLDALFYFICSLFGAFSLKMFLIYLFYVL